MRRSIDDLRTFYGEPTGALARRMLARRLEDAWGEAEGCDVLGLGYATPWLDGFIGARRTIAAMPGGQGAEQWAAAGRNRTVLVDDQRLPFAAGTFDRILLVHALEEADDPKALLTEAVRALAPSGRVILAAAARGGLWARAEATPFGHGRPYTRGQLAELLREAELEPSGWTRALYVPPIPWMAGWAEGFEQAGSRLWPGFAGLVLTEAVKETFAVKAKTARVRAPAVRPGLSPVPANRAPVSRAPEPSA